MAVRNFSFAGKPPCVRRDTRIGGAPSNAEVADEDEEENDAAVDETAKAVEDVDVEEPADVEATADVAGNGEDTEMRTIQPVSS